MITDKDFEIEEPITPPKHLKRYQNSIQGKKMIKAYHFAEKSYNFYLKKEVEPYCKYFVLAHILCIDILFQFLESKKDLSYPAFLVRVNRTTFVGKFVEMTIILFARRGEDFFFKIG
jgi:hypothetical protein